MDNKDKNENLGDQCPTKKRDEKIAPKQKKHPNKAGSLGETSDEKDNRDQCQENKKVKAETEMEVEIFHDKGNGAKGNTDAVYIKGRMGNTDMKMAALLKTDDINKEVDKMEEMLVRSGFDMDNVKITTMKVIQGSGQSKEDCFEQVKQAITSQTSCKACDCEREELRKRETEDATKDVTKYAVPEKTKEELQKEGEVYS